LGAKYNSGGRCTLNADFFAAKIGVADYNIADEDCQVLSMTQLE